VSNATFLIGSLHQRPQKSQTAKGHGGGGGRIGGRYPNGETLGLPTGLNLRPSSLADLLGLALGAPGTQCDFGAGVPLGNGFEGGAIALEVGPPDLTFCDLYPVGCLVALGAAAEGVQLYLQKKVVDAAVHALGDVIDPYNQYLRDLRECAKRYLPGPERDKCYEEAAKKLRGATGRGPVN